MTIGLWILGGCICLAVLIGAVRTGRPFRALLGSGLQGLCALAAVNIIGTMTGITVGLTAFTAMVCFALGIPGVATLLVLHAICFY